MGSFKDLGLTEEILEAIAWMNFNQPTPIQEQAIPPIVQGKDIIACAQTGTGKTGAFILPLLQLIPQLNNADSTVGPKAIIIAPTRELAQQIDEQIVGLAYFTNLSSVAIYGGGGGQDFNKEKDALKNGVDIVVGTPGRLLSHLNVGTFKISDIRFLILDEADRMLDMGFADDITRIIDMLPKDRQSLFFSATMPHGIRTLAKKFLKDPVEISLALSKPAANVKQLAIAIKDSEKIQYIQHFLKALDTYNKIVIFADTKSAVKSIATRFQEAKFPAKSISSDKEQKEREQIITDFKSGGIKILIATDIISRGIHIDDIDAVINYNVPGDAEDYVHRIGRTARAASKGQALTLVTSQEQYKFFKIEKLIGSEVEFSELPEGFSPTKPYNREELKTGKPPKEKSRFSNNKKPHGKKTHTKR